MAHRKHNVGTVSIVKVEHLDLKLTLGKILGSRRKIKLEDRKIYSPDLGIFEWEETMND